MIIEQFFIVITRKYLILRGMANRSAINLADLTLLHKKSKKYHMYGIFYPNFYQIVILIEI
jgi:hypothetical protein